MSTDTPSPLACVPGAIPPGSISSHFALLTQLFSTDARERREHPDGYAFRFESGALSDLVRWIGNERRCCPFLRFVVDVAPDGGDIWVRLSGPGGVHAFLDAELPPVVAEG
jgi:hypothetical protein